MSVFGHRFLFGLAWRLALLVAAAFAFAAALARPDLGAARIVAGLLVLGAAALLWRHVQRTNMELSRFIDAVRFGDFSQGFSHRGQGSGFAELSATLDEAIRRLRDERHKLIDANRFYEAVLDDAPTALLTVDADGKVELANKAARRLLVRHKGVRVEDFREYGDAFATALEGGAVNRPRLVPLLSDGVPQTMLVGAAIVHRLGGLVRVVAVQPIQGELNAIEIAAQIGPDPRPHPRDHELDDPGHLARPQRGRSDAQGRPGRQCRNRRRPGRGRDARPARRRRHAFRRELPPDQPRARDQDAADRRRRLGPRARIPVPRQRTGEGDRADAGGRRDR